MTNNIINGAVVLILAGLIALSIHNTKIISSNKKYRMIDKVISDAVFLAEKEGVVQKLSGLEQKTYAFKYAQKQLQKLGFTSLSEEQINAKIERIWAKNSDTLSSTYAQQKQDSQADASNDNVPTIKK